YKIFENVIVNESYTDSLLQIFGRLYSLYSSHKNVLLKVKEYLEVYSLNVCYLHYLMIHTLLFLKNFIEKYFKVLSMDQRKGRKMKVWTHTIDLAERGGKSLCAFTSASSFVGEQLWE
ncbi:Protein of unknown function, partial [Gryllus bimaculatus]